MPVATPVRKRPGPPESVECLEDSPSKKQKENPGENNQVGGELPKQAPGDQVPDQSTESTDDKTKKPDGCEATPSIFRSGGMTARQAWIYQHWKFWIINIYKCVMLDDASMHSFNIVLTVQPYSFLETCSINMFKDNTIVLWLLQHFPTVGNGV